MDVKIRELKEQKLERDRLHKVQRYEICNSIIFK
jgi:hypothetical protein